MMLVRLSTFKLQVLGLLVCGLSISASSEGASSVVYSTYTGPFAGYFSTKLDKIWTSPATPCGSLTFTAVSGFKFPIGISVGTSVTVVGIRVSDGYNGTCYNMIGVKSLTVNAAPKPSPTPTTTPTYSTYTGPFAGYFSPTLKSIWTNPAPPCGNLTFTAASGFTFPAGIAVGTSVTLVGIRVADGYSTSCYNMTDVKSLMINSKPTPTPTPTPKEDCKTIGSITKLPYCPYASNSTWNQPLPIQPAIDANSQVLLNNTFRNYGGKFYVNPPIPESFPFYFTRPGDPQVTIDLTLNYGPSNLEGAMVPMPVNAVPAEGSDAHLTILNASTGDEYDYFVFPHNQRIVSGDRISVGFGNKVNYITGSGWGGATTAAGAALLGGLVTVDEFQSGTIHHALALAPGCNNGAGSVYPATATATFNCPTSTGAAIPHGSRIWSDLTPAQVSALGLDVVSTMILNALHQYGGFVTDTNGWKALDVRNLMESPLTPEGEAWWRANGGNSPALNYQPASFFTTHFHILKPCVTQGGC